MANIFVYGGCVTRDAFEHMKDEHSLVQYVARQSLISAASRPTTTLSVDSLGEGFQNRSVRGDLESSLHSLIRKSAPRTDLFIFDILSERLGIFRVPGGTFITRSVELAKTGLINTLPRPATGIGFGTDRHFNLWTPAADKLLTRLKNSDLFDRALLFEVPWTNLTDEGEEVPKFRGWDAAHANELYARYYAYFREQGLRVTTIPETLAVSTTDHKWGPSPYHFVDEAYLWMKKEVLAVLEEATPKGSIPEATV